MAYLWPDFGLIIACKGVVWHDFVACFYCLFLWLVRFGTDLRGLFGTVLWPVVARFGTDL